MIRKMTWGALLSAFTLPFLMGFLAHFNPPSLPPSESNCMTDSVVDLVRAAGQAMAYVLISAILGWCSAAAWTFVNEAQRRQAMAASFAAPLLVSVVMALNYVSYPSQEAQKLWAPFSAPIIWSAALLAFGVKPLLPQKRTVFK